MAAHAPRSCGLRGETGQTIVLFAVCLVVLLGMVGFVVDLGYAYYVKRSLQSSADAAALAGASGLPDPSVAEALAHQYGGSDSGKNERGTVPSVTTSAKTKCISIAPCYPANAITVTEKTTIKTMFLGVLGVDTIDVTAKGTACSPCAVTPVDVMLVLDRTFSMCQYSNGTHNPSCTDLENARSGIKTFIGFMDPAYDKVGLAVLPPARNSGDRCNSPTTPQTATNYDNPNAPYLLVPLSQDYKQNGVLNQNSSLVSTVNCVKGGGITAYANAIDVAQAELQSSRGRPDAIDVIVFLSDGAANYGPSYYPSSSPYRRQPCRSGVTSAGAAKSKGTIVYTIGYDLNANGGNANRCELYPSGNAESPTITAYDALRQMATDTTTFFNQPSAGELQTIYTKIAASIGGARLIPDDAT